MKKSYLSSIKILKQKIAFSALAFALPIALSAQEFPAPTQASVEHIRIQYVELHNVSESFIKSHIKLEEGLPYDQVKMDQSIRELYKTGKFEFIQSKVEKASDGKVDVVIIVQPKYRLDRISFKGNNQDLADDLKDELTIRTGDMLDEAKIKDDIEILKQYLVKRYYPFAKISYTVEKNAGTADASLLFNLESGEKLRINNITFAGNANVEEDDLRDVMKTDTWWTLTSWITGAGRYDENVFFDDIKKIRDYYREKGFLDVAIPHEKIEFDFPEDNRMSILIRVEEGRQYHIGKVSIKGNTLFTQEEILATAKIQSGDVFVPSKVDAATGAVEDYYGSRGYLSRRVIVERQPNLETNAIDLTFHVSEGNKAYVESIRIDGNTKTKNIVILRELALAPGDTFDLVRMRNSEARLKNTRFFNDANGNPQVTLSYEPTNIPDRYDLKIQLQEGRTGNLSFGAGFSSLERLVFYVELTQGNFDLLNPKSYFQGDGQKFHTRLQLGTKSTQALVSFEEPWIWERQLSGGVNLYYTESKYDSDTYNESRVGFELFLRKRLFELVEGKLSYTFENVGILDVDSDAPSQIQQEEGWRTVSKVGLTLTRDTRDSFIYPTRGSRFQLINELAGTVFGGETDYYRLEFRGSQYFKTYGEQVFSVIGKIGTVTPTEDNYVPFFDRYFLGGPNWMRGFDYREVGPDENEEPIGGNSMATFSLEYSVPLFHPIRFAVFYDWGFVNSNDWDFSASNYNDNWGIGIRMLIMGAPLRLDLAFPITTDDWNDQSSQFYFSFGSQF